MIDPSAFSSVTRTNRNTSYRGRGVRGVIGHGIGGGGGVIIGHGNAYRDDNDDGYSYSSPRQPQAQEQPQPSQQYYGPTTVELFRLKRIDPWDTDQTFHNAKNSINNNHKTGDNNAASKETSKYKLFDDHTSLVKRLASIKNKNNLFNIQQIIKKEEEEEKRQEEQERRNNHNTHSYSRKKSILQKIPDPTKVLNAKVEKTLARANKQFMRSRVGTKYFKADDTGDIAENNAAENNDNTANNHNHNGDESAFASASKLAPALVLTSNKVDRPQQQRRTATGAEVKEQGSHNISSNSNTKSSLKTRQRGVRIPRNVKQSQWGSIMFRGCR
jgi:hypothetical protein